jgi:hypothetical protein
LDVLRDTALQARALKLLGCSEDESDRSRMRYGYYRRMLLHHPDANPGDPRAHDKAALVNEAFRMARGSLDSPKLLLDDDLVREVLGESVESVQGAPTYEEWLRAQYYDIEGRSIWPV